MKKIKYFYNTHTLRYEKLVTPLRVKLLRVFGFLAAVAVSGFLITQLAYRYFPSANEKRLLQENDRMQDKFALIQQELQQLSKQLREIEKRDNQVYRTIFEASPLPDSAREKMLEKQQEDRLIASLTDEELNSSLVFQIKNLRSRLAAQSASFNAIEGMVKNKEALLAATPAIQPINNKDLNRLASGFGYRIDPVYKTTKFHAGLDFAAPQGTPVYATADGVVKLSGNTGDGYGNHVIINHGFSYQTLYGHLFRIKARVGQRVKRGEVIGWVGNTGKSTGPHLHYEVHKNGRPLDPIYFFYNDLTPEQFDRMLKIAATGNQSFD
ncbi:MAG TPA: peptidoglycan DD-metalloendopeptidase family protein [Lacibacter sp.]|nr:peptidoglycan DD-metalloendopeptidase family protein [Lacibacter sp.]HMO88085.1 peptidoglycan DD-metalloendopeptidase family protein [Lacibacter sp.]